jgi:Na+/glutamate symporter
MRKLILLLLAACAGAWMWNNPFPQKINAFIVAVFVTLGIYKELKKLIEDGRENNHKTNV